MKLTLMGKYHMVVDDDNFIGVNNELLSLSPYLRSLVLYTKGVEKDVKCYYNIAKIIAARDKVNTVSEYFAGLGILTMFIQKFMRLRRHVVSDFSTSCVNHLVQTFQNNAVKVLSARDAFEQGDKFYVGEFTSIDFDTTFMKLSNLSSRHRMLLDLVASNGAKYIHFSDKSLAYFHVNKKHYSKKFGVVISTIEDYAIALDKYLTEETGYFMINFMYYSGAAHILLSAYDDVLTIEPVVDYRGCLEIDSVNGARKVIL